jgi:glycine/D-amino acid oxidase-like deaminating enzyme
MSAPIVVIGGGIVGSAIAWQLQKRGAPVVLVERDAEPQGASYFSFASLTALDEASTSLYALKCLGMSHWRSWQRELGDLGVTWDGEVRWAETAVSAEHLKNRIDEGVRRGYPVETLNYEQLMQHQPHVRPSRVLAASRVGDDGQADPPVAIARLRESFTEASGTILTGRASLRFDADRIVVRVGTQDLEASRVVIAAGAETSAFLDRFGWDIPMTPSPGLLVKTTPAPALITGTVYASTESGPSIHMRQLSGGRLLIGEQSQDYATNDPTMEHANRLLRQAQRILPDLSGSEVERFTVEWRPMPRDGMPIVGSLPGVSSIYLATTHSGVTLAPALADLVAKELLDNHPAHQLDECRPARFARREATLARDVESAFEGPTEIFLG